MKAILASLCLSGSLLAADKPELAGVWVPADKELRCMCGHETQLQFIQVRDTSEYEVVEYCLGHNQAAALGGVKRSDTKPKFQALKNTVEYTISDDQTTLTMTGGTKLEGQALILKRIDGDVFWKALAKIPATELNLVRNSMLFSSPDEARENPFEPEEEVANDHKQPTTTPKTK